MRQRRRGWKGDSRNGSAANATFVVTHRKEKLSLSLSVNSSAAVLCCAVLWGVCAFIHFCWCRCAFVCMSVCACVMFYKPTLNTIIQIFSQVFFTQNSEYHAVKNQQFFSGKKPIFWGASAPQIKASVNPLVYLVTTAERNGRPVIVYFSYHTVLYDTEHVDFFTPLHPLLLRIYWRKTGAVTSIFTRFIAVWMAFFSFFPFFKYTHCKMLIGAFNHTFTWVHIKVSHFVLFPHHDINSVTCKIM